MELVCQDEIKSIRISVGIEFEIAGIKFFNVTQQSKQ